MRDRNNVYTRREAGFSKLLSKQQKTERRISNLRLLVFALGLGFGILMLLFPNYILLLTGGLALVAIAFIYLVIIHEGIVGRVKYSTILRDINSDSLKRLQGEWDGFPDDGGEFKDDDHSYTSDLDIFGPSSLFQWTNAAQTFMGRQKLKELFSGLVGNKGDLALRQDSVEELSGMLSWRQRFLADGIIAKKKNDSQDIISWAKETNPHFGKAWVKALVIICPIITITLIILGFVLNLVPWAVPITALIVQYGLLSYKGRDRTRVFDLAARYAQELRVYSKMLRRFEKQSFSTDYLISLQEGIKCGGQPAHKQMGKLSSIIDSIANRRNMAFFIINVITLWDFQNLIALEKWKRQSGGQLKTWFDTLGNVEALSSLAIIGFDNPDWAMPRISDGKDAFFKAEALGHPLLKKAKRNDVAIDEYTKVLLITGSNMSGKSTLLRTTGINLVLAYAGARVCAKSFEASMMEVASSMRVSDNLGESVSSFYAELLRIKDIVKKASAGNKVFFLLDEIFKGTNSMDRHTGAKALVNKLSQTNSIGMVSTHDLELCILEKENSLVANYHFQEFYKDGKIDFDYKLRSGPSTTRNALYLMQLAGLDVEEEVTNKE